MQLSTFDELKVYFKGSNTKKNTSDLITNQCKSFLGFYDHNVIYSSYIPI